MCLRRGGSRTGWRPRRLRYPIGWVARTKGADRLIYAVVGMRRGGGGGGGGGGGVKCEERASGVSLACGFGACCLACGFRACWFCLLALYDTGRVRCCQGGILGNMSSDAGGGDGEWVTQRRKDAMKSRRGIPAYAGMTGGGGGNGGTQRRRGAMKRRRGIPAYAGMT